MPAKNIVIIILVLVLIGVAGFVLFNKSNDTTVIKVETPTEVTETTSTETAGETDGTTETPTEVVTEDRGEKSTVGTSVDGAEILAHHFGTGETEILFVGGVHGGYSPNTAKLANELISYLEDNEEIVPDNVMVTIIPNLNPDGSKMSGADGRFNSNNVDLNRNFDCEWSEKAIWKSQEVSGGTAPLSEPEAIALSDYVNEYEPAAAVVWFSAEGKVYPSACTGTPSKKSVELAATFASAASYPAAAEFDAYAITGDMVNWMAKQDIPAISVLLSDHQGTELSKNKAGMEAVLKAYAE